MDLANLLGSLETFLATTTRAGRVTFILLMSAVCVAVGSLLWFMSLGAEYDLPLRLPQAAYDLSECGQGVVSTVEHLEQHKLLTYTPNTETMIKEICK